MDLSAATKIDLVRGIYGPYMKMTRQRENKSMWLNFTEDMTGALMDNVVHLDRSLQTRNGGRYELAPNAHVEVCEYLGKMYVCFTIRNGDYHNRMNLNVDEWTVMSKNSKRITAFFKGKQPASRQKSVAPKRKRKIEEKIVYSWSDSTGSSSIGFYNEQDCLIDHKEKGNAVEEPLIASVSLPFPSKEVWLREIMLHLLHREIHLLVTANCKACSLDDPSQFNHLNGCLDSWDAMVDTYMSLAHIDAQEVALVYNAVMTYCSVDDRVQSVKKPAVSKQDLIDIDIDSAFQFAIKSACLKMREK